MSVPAFRLEHWDECHREAFVLLHQDAIVMADLGGPYSRAESDAKFNRYKEAWQNDGISRWAVTNAHATLLGYAGVMKRSDPNHPLADHYEIGWRFNREYWGQGLATMSAQQALAHAWSILETSEILSYTAADNSRSQAIMHRLGLERDAQRDFEAVYTMGKWRGLVWVAPRPI